jgi:hypothetical protein
VSFTRLFDEVGCGETCGAAAAEANCFQVNTNTLLALEPRVEAIRDRMGPQLRRITLAGVRSPQDALGQHRAAATCAIRDAGDDCLIAPPPPAFVHRVGLGTP